MLKTKAQLCTVLGEKKNDLERYKGTAKSSVNNING